MEAFKTLTDYIHASSIGPVLFIFEVVLALAIIIIFFALIGKTIENSKIMALIICVTISLIISFVLGWKILLVILLIILMWILGLAVVLYGKNIRRGMDRTFKMGKYKKGISETEKTEMIASLCKSAEYLSRRKVGALISIERYDNLNDIIEKSIPINGEVTEELLTTIFTVGTACHDGAVIISGNKIACASAYFPSTDKYDIPKSLGTRHRAAIGLSERFDAFTIVVSEETGYVSYTIDGNIYLNVTIDKLRDELNNYIKVE